MMVRRRLGKTAVRKTGRRGVGAIRLKVVAGERRAAPRGNEADGAKYPLREHTLRRAAAI